MFNTTDVPTENFYCLDNANVSNWVITIATIFQWTQCTTAVTLGLYSIFMHHLKQKSMNTYLRTFSIIGTCVWMITAITWMINYQTSFNCSAQASQINKTSELCAIATNGMGYVILDVCFAIRLIKAFNDTLWELSSCTRGFIYITIIFGVLVGIAGLAFLVYDISTRQIGFLCFGVALILYIFLAVLILVLIISKTYNFISFISDRNDSHLKSNSNCKMTINHNNIYTNKKINIRVSNPKQPHNNSSYSSEKNKQTQLTSRDWGIRSLSVSKTETVTPSTNSTDRDHMHDNDAQNSSVKSNISEQCQDRKVFPQQEILSKVAIGCELEQHSNKQSPIEQQDSPYTNTNTNTPDTHETGHDDKITITDSSFTNVPKRKIVYRDLQAHTGDNTTTLTDGVFEVKLQNLKHKTHVSKSNSVHTRNTNTIAYDINMKKNNRKKLLHETLFELIIRLIVIYTISLLSTFVVILMYAYLFVLFSNKDYASVRQANIFIRIVYITESIISCMALTMQNSTAQPLYYRFCKICHVIVEKCCLKCANNTPT